MSRAAARRPASVSTRILAGVLVLGLACLLKLSFGHADANRLAWLLEPTAALVEFCSGLRFLSCGEEGYLNHELNILIAPACSGVNFLLIAATMAGLMGFLRLRSTADQLLFALAMAPCAYLATLLVNTCRILLAIFLYRADISSAWLTWPRLHRIEGVVVYYLFLCFFSWLVSTLLSYWEKISGHSPRQWSCSPVLIFPLICYLFFALAVPLLNNALRQGTVRFGEHGLTVLLLSCGLSLMLWLKLRHRRPCPGKEWQDHEFERNAENIYNMIRASWQRDLISEQPAVFYPMVDRSAAADRERPGQGSAVHLPGDGSQNQKSVVGKPGSWPDVPHETNKSDLEDESIIVDTIQYALETEMFCRPQINHEKKPLSGGRQLPQAGALTFDQFHSQ